MKLSNRSLRIFWDIHAMAGVFTGLVLHVMFFAGAFSLFHEEIGVWQDPPTASTEQLRGLDELIGPMIRENHLEVWCIPLLAGSKDNPREASKQEL